jgi:hypothetical protein
MKKLLSKNEQDRGHPDLRRVAGNMREKETLGGCPASNTR